MKRNSDGTFTISKKTMDRLDLAGDDDIIQIEEIIPNTNGRDKSERIIITSGKKWEAGQGEPVELKPIR